MSTFNGTDAADFEVLRKGTEYDTLYGGDGDDELVGFAPHTSVYGGRGNDIVAGAFFGPVGGGTLANPFHNYAVFDLGAFGLAGHNTLSSLVDGGAGSDLVIGSNGTDVLYGGDGNDGGIITFSFDIFEAGLYGERGNDYLDGGRGNDLLVGGQGTDRLIGGDGADTFRFARNGATGAFDSVVGGGRDVIKDFSHAEHDRIDVSPIDANVHTAGNQAFLYIGTHAFHHVSGELREVAVSGRTIVEGDINGDGHADFQIGLTGSINLVRGDFVL